MAGRSEVCPFCHELVDADRFDRHVRRHTKLRPDGQMTDHVTLPPEERAPGRIDRVPTVYVHGRCGVATVMPDEIVRSYLKNPFLYNDRTFCCGCETYVNMRQCRWVDTDQPLDEYFADLRAEARRDGRGRPTVAGWVLPVLFAFGGGFGGGLLAAKAFGPRWFVVGGLVGFVAGGVSGVVSWLRREAGGRPGGRRTPRNDDDDGDPPRRRTKRRRDYDE